MATDQHICEHCGYDLSTSIRGERDEVTCPECGGYSLPEQIGSSRRQLRGILSTTTRDLLSTYAVLIVVGVLLFFGPGFLHSGWVARDTTVKRAVMALFPLSSIAWAVVLVLRARAIPRLRRQPGMIAKTAVTFVVIACVLMLVPVIVIWLLIVIGFAVLF